MPYSRDRSNILRKNPAVKSIPTLHATISGQGPTVVLLHGYLASSAYWQKVTDELSQTNRVISLDLLGFGKSPKPGCSKYDYDAQTRSIERTLNVLGVKNQFTLIGHSMGSLIALRYARSFPQQVTKLMLANMPILLNKAQAKKEILGGNFVYNIGLRRGLHWVIWPLFKIAMRLQLIPKTVADNVPARRSYIFQNTSVSRLRSMRNVIFAATIQTDLRDIKVSTLILSGLQDRARYIQNLSQLRNDLQAHIRIASIPGGHHLPLTHSQIFCSFAND